MYIARILYPVKVLGPGNRIGIWFDGCKHHCEGCSNPELWEFSGRYKTSVETVMKLVNSIAENHKIDGFTITGGDPFEQPKALKELLAEIKEISEDILIYTGYDYETISELYPETVNMAAVIIDGKYIEERNNNVILRGSDNQKIIILNEGLKLVYDRYIAKTTNEIQNFTTSDGVVSVGIHRPDYNKRLNDILEAKGLKKNE